LAFLPIWSARLVWDTFGEMQRPQRLLIMLGFSALLLSNARPQLEALFGPQDTAAAELSSYLAANVPRDAVVASWEWNLDTSAPQQFYHPPALVMYQVIDLVQRGRTVPNNLYDPASGRPQYLIDGPFSSWTGIYRNFIASHGDKLTQFGPYALYRVRR
jgi:hypothetical protein